MLFRGLSCSCHYAGGSQTNTADEDAWVSFLLSQAGSPLAGSMNSTEDFTTKAYQDLPANLSGVSEAPQVHSRGDLSTLYEGTDTQKPRDLSSWSA